METEKRILEITNDQKEVFELWRWVAKAVRENDGQHEPRTCIKLNGNVISATDGRRLHMVTFPDDAPAFTNGLWKVVELTGRKLTMVFQRHLEHPSYKDVIEQGILKYLFCTMSLCVGKPVMKVLIIICKLMRIQMMVWVV